MHRRTAAIVAFASVLILALQVGCGNFPPR